MSNEEWENLCDGCAKCCEVKKGVACPSLGSDNRCTVYDNRFEIEICLKVTPKNVTYLRKKGTLPDSCAYVRYMENLSPLSVDEIEEATLIPFGLASLVIQDYYLDKRVEYLNYSKRSI